MKIVSFFVLMFFSFCVVGMEIIQKAPEFLVLSGNDQSDKWRIKLPGAYVSLSEAWNNGYTDFGCDSNKIFIEVKDMDFATAGAFCAYLTKAYAVKKKDQNEQELVKNEKNLSDFIQSIPLKRLCDIVNKTDEIVLDEELQNQFISNIALRMKNNDNRKIVWQKLTPNVRNAVIAYEIDRKKLIESTMSFCANFFASTKVMGRFRDTLVYYNDITDTIVSLRKCQEEDRLSRYNKFIIKKGTETIEIDIPLKNIVVSRTKIFLYANHDESYFVCFLCNYGTYDEQKLFIIDATQREVTKTFNFDGVYKTCCFAGVSNSFYRADEKKLYRLNIVSDQKFTVVKEFVNNEIITKISSNDQGDCVVYCGTNVFFHKNQCNGCIDLTENVHKVLPALSKKGSVIKEVLLNPKQPVMTVSYRKSLSYKRYSVVLLYDPVTLTLSRFDPNSLLTNKPHSGSLSWTSDGKFLVLYSPPLMALAYDGTLFKIFSHTGSLLCVKQDTSRTLGSFVCYGKNDGSVIWNRGWIMTDLIVENIISPELKKVLSILQTGDEGLTWDDILLMKKIKSDKAGLLKDKIDALPQVLQNIFPEQLFVTPKMIALGTFMFVVSYVIFKYISA